MSGIDNRQYGYHSQQMPVSWGQTRNPCPMGESFVSPPPIPPRPNMFGQVAGNGNVGNVWQKKPVVMPDKLNGTGSLTDYLAHFEMCATINGWNDQQKASFLAVSLRDTAQMLLGDLTGESLLNFDILKRELESRFGLEAQSELFRTQVKNRRKKSSESLAELGQDIKRLTARAYTDATPGLRDILAKGHFIDALTEGEMRMHIYQSKPATLQDAIHVATEWQAFRTAELQRQGSHPDVSRRPVRATNVSSDKSSSQDMPELAKQIEELKSELARLNKGKHDQGLKPNPRNQARTEQGKPKAGGHGKVCWNCGEEGHYKYSCPYELYESVRAKPQAQSQGNKD